MTESKNKIQSLKPLIPGSFVCVHHEELDIYPEQSQSLPAQNSDGEESSSVLVYNFSLIWEMLLIATATASYHPQTWSYQKKS